MTPLSVTRVGEGPPLALVHGWGFAATSLRPLAEVLARRRSVELVELPGHGGSRDRVMPPDLPGLAAQLDATLPSTRDWVGWSLGGLACLQLAQSFPARVRRLGMLAATPRFTASPDWTTALPPSELDAFARALGDDVEATLHRFAALVAHGDRAGRAVLRTLRDALACDGQPEPDALASGLALLATGDLTAANGVPVPSLWLLGGTDALVPAGLAQSLRGWRGAEVTVFEGAGHAPFLSQTDACAARLESFFDD